MRLLQMVGHVLHRMPSDALNPRVNFEDGDGKHFEYYSTRSDSSDTVTIILRAL